MKKVCVDVCVRAGEWNRWREEAPLDVIMKDDSHTR